MGAVSGSFWLSAFCVAFTPTAIGYQDLAGFFAHHAGVSERWRDHLIASPFGTIHVARFSFSRPIGTAMPEPLAAQPVNFDPRSLDVKAWSVYGPAMARPGLQIEYPRVNRGLKANRMPAHESAPDRRKPTSVPQLLPLDASRSATPPAAAVAPQRKQDGTSGIASDAATDAFGSLPTDAPHSPKVAAFRPAKMMTDAFGSLPRPVANRQVAAALASGLVAQAQREGAAGSQDDSADKPPEIPAAAEGEAAEITSAIASLSVGEEDEGERITQLYFGVAAMGSPNGLQPWAPGAKPVPASSAIDPDIKRSVAAWPANVKLSALTPANSGAGGETVAAKGNVSQFESPADRLGLSGKTRTKAEKCIADAVYFEARSEPLRGQMAVAQVVMNRVFSGRYPRDVCGVVYQNAYRHLACQFTFACEGKNLSHINEPAMWAQAKRIAKDTLDGKIWLTQVGHATHYHAYWVHPYWVHDMAKLYRVGAHTFYRPRAWGDGSDAPVWGQVPLTAKPAAASGQKPQAAKEPAAGAKNREATAKGSQAAASPAEPSGTDRTPTAKL
jgi:spore germination cell wall hydrolase CwlJ-like protein